MSFDIRRCSREDLDRINAEAKAWRERGNKPDQEPLPEPAGVQPPADIPVQLDLFGTEQP